MACASRVERADLGALTGSLQGGTQTASSLGTSLPLVCLSCFWTQRWDSQLCVHVCWGIPPPLVSPTYTQP